MTPVDRQNRGRGRFLRVTSGHAARIRISSGFETELERPANPRGGRSKWNSTGPLFPSSRFLLLPLACPLLSISLSGEPPRRPLNVNDRSPNDEVPPMYNATLPLECNRNEHASNPEPLTKRVRSTSVYLFALRIFAIPLEHVVSNEICPRNFFVVGSSLEGGGRIVIGELHSFHLQRIKLRKISLLVLL